MGRVKRAAKNIAVGYISNIATAVLGFVLRTVFIMRLNETLLGVNSLYSNILSMLSLAELGIGTAMNYSLYGPMARGETEIIKSYMQLYRKAYRAIAAVIACVGLALVPFLPNICKGASYLTRTQLTVYYLIFLFNTVSTYFVSYKYSLCLAEQKDYIQTNILMITKAVTVILQIAVVLLTSNFLLFLLVSAAVQLVQIFIANAYLNKLYPYLKDRDVTPLDKESKDEVKTKTKALMLHKIGDTARLQTDAIIISSFINVTTVGIVDNYNLIINTISGFVNIIFNSVITGFGNLIATESEEKQFRAFKVYRFFAVWVYGFSAVGFYVLLTPLVQIWLHNEKWVLAPVIVGTVLTDYYFKGERVALMNYKTAAGIYEPDKYLSLIQGAVNLVLSIWLVIKVGLVGVYIGTVVSGLIANVTKPVIVYKYCFHRSSKDYFIDSFKYILVMILELAILLPIKSVVMKNVTFTSFIIMFGIVCVVFNAVFLAFFGRTRECRYIFGVIKGKMKRKQGK
jgi:O-antigen/teichoic acid export membrane protein